MKDRGALIEVVDFISVEFEKAGIIIIANNTLKFHTTLHSFFKFINNQYAWKFLCWCVCVCVCVCLGRGGDKMVCKLGIKFQSENFSQKIFYFSQIL